MSYIDNLKHIVKTNCVLEIMQHGGHGYTQRVGEVIIYDKKLITNNSEIKSAPFYNSTSILVLNNIDDIDSNLAFFDNFDRKVNFYNKQDISPIRLLEFITEHL